MPYKSRRDKSRNSAEYHRDHRDIINNRKRDSRKRDGQNMSLSKPHLSRHKRTLNNSDIRYSVGDIVEFKTAVGAISSGTIIDKVIDGRNPVVYLIETVTRYRAFRLADEMILIRSRRIPY